MAARRPKRALRKRGLVVTEGTCTEPQVCRYAQTALSWRTGQREDGWGRAVPHAGSQSCTQGGETGKAKLRTIRLVLSAARRGPAHRPR